MSDGKRQRAPRRVVILLSVVIVIAAIILVTSYIATRTKVDTTSQVTEAPHKNSDSVPNGNPNQSYGQLVREENEKNATAAEKTGSTFMPTIGGHPNSGLGLDVADLKDEPDEKEPPSPAPKTTPPPDKDDSPSEPRSPSRLGLSGQDDLEPDPDLAKAIRKELQQVMMQRSVPEQSVDVFDNDRRGTPVAASNPAQFSGPSLGRQVPPRPTETKSTMATQVYSSSRGRNGSRNTDDGPSVQIKSGTMDYAVTDLALNSDAPGPAMVTVLSGPRKGGKYMGQFKREHESLVVKFDRFIPKNGKAVGIEAYAVDPDESETNVATSVNNHTVSRWASLFLAKFAEGYGQAIQRSGSVSTYGVGPGGTSAIFTNPTTSEGEKALEALGEVGKAAGDQIEKNFDRPPTVKLAPGTPIAVLVVHGSKDR